MIAADCGNGFSCHSSGACAVPTPPGQFCTASGDTSVLEQDVSDDMCSIIREM